MLPAIGSIRNVFHEIRIQLLLPVYTQNVDSNQVELVDEEL